MRKPSGQAGALEGKLTRGLETYYIADQVISGWQGIVQGDFIKAHAAILTLYAFAINPNLKVSSDLFPSAILIREIVALSALPYQLNNEKGKIITRSYGDEENPQGRCIASTEMTRGKIYSTCLGKEVGSSTDDTSEETTEVSSFKENKDLKDTITTESESSLSDLDLLKMADNEASDEEVKEEDLGLTEEDRKALDLIDKLQHGDRPEDIQVGKIYVFPKDTRTEEEKTKARPDYVDQELDDDVEIPRIEEEKLDPEEYIKMVEHPDYMKIPELKEGQTKDKNGRILPRYPGWYLYSK